jgi:beta-galactosidase
LPPQSYATFAEEKLTYCRLKSLMKFFCLILIFLLTFAANLFAQTGSPRERRLMDFGWRFAFGNATNPGADFDPAPVGQTFSYFAKAGAALGAAAENFDDSGWRILDLPHDWAVEAPFNVKGSASHGYKAIGKNFPERSIGWYRKTFNIPASDLGRQITVEFDGVFRDSQVWINGFYLGRESSGYTPFSYNISDYLNYGASNTIVVRVDASLEEGWFYEGAGIYRHVWLVKTAPLHVARWGTFVTSDLKNDYHSANVTAHVTINNDSTNDTSFKIVQTILDADGEPIASGNLKNLSLKPDESGEFSSMLTVSHPKLWSLETPYMHKLVTTVISGGKVMDRYETPFGIRTLRWDTNEGFFLNGEHVELKGTCDHQDAAGVGVAVPDELNFFRVEQLKKMGSNAIRTSHNAPTPELLDACDRLGMLVMDENREFGINPQELDELETLIKRDRNHPCVVIWSLGNEEWNIESNEKGARVTQTIQTFAQQLDPTRRFTAAISGGWGHGSSTAIDVMGFNYFTHGNNDEYHTQFPGKPSVATEDASTFSTRGIYFEDLDHQHLTAYDTNKPNWGSTAEESWSHYAVRPYVAGLFQWTGFDYRGEETPFGWPAISSQFGILDTCGFPKDNFYYYQSWWSDKPVLHLFPHWNWPGKEGQDINVWVFSNCEEVELFLNGVSMGRQRMPKNSHLEWNVKYEPGTLRALGYTGGKEILADQIETTGNPAAIQLTPDRATINADREDVSIITVQVKDAQGRLVPTADNRITFQIAGPGRIIGVGNGDPSSHEPDVYVATCPDHTIDVVGWKWRLTADARGTDVSELGENYDDTAWDDDNVNVDSGPLQPGQSAVFRGRVAMTAQDLQGQSFKLGFGRIDDEGWVYVNGHKVGESHNWQAMPVFDVKPYLHVGENIVAVTVANDGGSGGVNLGVKLRVHSESVSPEWKRSLFGGLAQVIVQSTGGQGEITLTAKLNGLTDGVLKLESQPVPLRPAVAAN